MGCRYVHFLFIFDVGIFNPIKKVLQGENKSTLTINVRNVEETSYGHIIVAFLLSHYIPLVFPSSYFTPCLG